MANITIKPIYRNLTQTFDCRKQRINSTNRFFFCSRKCLCVCRCIKRKENNSHSGLQALRRTMELLNQGYTPGRRSWSFAARAKPSKSPPCYARSSHTEGYIIVMSTRPSSE
uniref:Uncharacterized protein n=1 Tax=Aegilops tauschii subsp. strangulata TaxID=200361 RepID=A0A453QLR8_AEGTS